MNARCGSFEAYFVVTNRRYHLFRSRIHFHIAAFAFSSKFAFLFVFCHSLVLHIMNENGNRKLFEVRIEPRMLALAGGATVLNFWQSN